jgi:hypothetical protein
MENFCEPPSTIVYLFIKCHCQNALALNALLTVNALLPRAHFYLLLSNPCTLITASLNTVLRSHALLSLALLTLGPHALWLMHFISCRVTGLFVRYFHDNS